MPFGKGFQTSANEVPESSQAGQIFGGGFNSSLSSNKIKLPVQSSNNVAPPPIKEDTTTQSNPSQGFGSGFRGGFNRSFSSKEIKLPHPSSNQQNSQPARRNTVQQNNPNQGFGGGFNRSFSANNIKPPFQAGDKNTPPTKKHIPPYYPQDRSLTEIYAEDELVQTDYRLVSEQDLPIFHTHSGGENLTIVQPIDSWHNFQLHPRLEDNIVQLSHYVRPRNIQSYVIPYFFADFDIKAQAETGTGKTAAFLIPLIEKLSRMEPREQTFKPRPIAIIVVPTRELCMQITEQARKLAYCITPNIRICKAFGEIMVGLNLRELNAGCDILVACPGRLCDYIKRTVIELNCLKYFVLDEADYLLDMTDFKCISDILGHPSFPKKENLQTMLFSATFPVEVQELANTILRPKNVLISNNHYVGLNPNVQHQFFYTPNIDAKKEALRKIFFEELEAAHQQDPLLTPAELPNTAQGPKKSKTHVLIFVEHRRNTDVLVGYIKEFLKLNAISLSGDRSQAQRQLIMNDFKAGQYDALVTTDLCSRGIDIKNLDHVVNYDLPRNIESFIHRVGRTGRIKPGLASSFFDPVRDKELAEKLVGVLKEANKQPSPELLNTALGRPIDWSEDIVNDSAEDGLDATGTIISGVN